MTAILKYARDVLLLVLLSTLIIFTIILTRAVQQVTLDVTSASASLQKTSNQLTESTKMLQQHADRVLTEAGLTAMEARKASSEQRAYWNKEVPVLTAKTELTLDHTNQLLADMDTMTQHVDGNVSQITTQLGTTNLQVQQDLKSFNDSLSLLNQSLASPQLSDTLTSVNQSMASMASVTKHLDATTADLQAKVHTMVTPPATVKGKIWWIVQDLLNLTKTAVELRYYATQ